MLGDVPAFKFSLVPSVSVFHVISLPGSLVSFFWFFFFPLFFSSFSPLVLPLFLSSLFSLFSSGFPPPVPLESSVFIGDVPGSPSSHGFSLDKHGWEGGIGFFAGTWTPEA
jgi:hypothetical protein